MPQRKRAPKKNTAKKVGRKTLGPKKPRLKPLSLLILECDADKLNSQSLAVASELNHVIRLLPVKLTVELAFINSEADIRERFVDYAQRYSSIKLIVVIAHSNREVISVAPDLVLQWQVFGRWVEKFKPKQMVFVACEAGQYPSTQTLFDQMESLRTIYASPIKTSKEQAEIIKLLVPYLMLSKTQDSELIRVFQILNFLRSGSIILRCSRRRGEWTSLLQFLSGLTD
jgi:hypothetical protein